MPNMFWRQFWALMRKNLIVINNHQLLNIGRCLLLPTAFALFFAYVFEIFSRPNNLGFGAAAPIASLSDTWTTDTIYYVDATADSPSRVPAFMSTLVASANLVSSQQSRIKPLASVDAIHRSCPSNFRLISKCFAVLIFDYIPSGPQDAYPMNYTIRVDSGRRMVNVHTRMSDYERVSLPLQWAVDKAGMETLGVLGVSTPQEWPYTRYSNSDIRIKQRLSYLDVVQSFLGFVFFFGFLGVAYHLSGALVDESASGLGSLMYVMGCSCAARIMSWHLSISLIYLPAWITTAVIWHYRVFSQTDIGLIITIHIIAGFSLASFSLVACMPFRKSPQLAAIGTTSVAILLAILALFVPMNPVATVLYTLVFPPGFFVFAVKIISKSEQNLRSAQLMATDGQEPLAPLIGAAVVNVFVWLLIAGVIEGWSLDPEWPKQLYWSLGLRHFARLCPSKLESEITSANDVHTSQNLPDPNVPPAEIVLDNLTKAFPSAKRHAPPITAVENLSLSIPSYGIFVLLGSNGSGKSTTLRMIAGLEEPTSGSIAFRDSVAESPVEGRTYQRRPLGLVPQRDVLFSELTCYQTVRLWREIKAPHTSKDSSVALETSTQALEQLLDDCGLHAKIHSPTATLSGGQKRKLQLAAGLVGGSHIVLVDEATSGVDPLSRRAIWRALSKAREGRCVVFTTHFLDEADLLADEIAVLVAPGKLVAQGTPVSLKSKLGDGYTVHITRSPNAPFVFHAPVLSAIRIHAPLATLDETENDTYLLHSKDAEVVGLVLDVLENQKEKLGVGSYVVKSTTLEAIFLKLMGPAGMRGERVAMENYPNVLRNSGFLSTAETVVASDSSLEIKLKPEPLALCDGRQISPFRQALIGFHKRILILRRSWLPYALMIIVAIAGACVPIFFIRHRVSTCSLSQGLELAQSLYLPTAASRALPVLGSPAMNMYKPVISPPNLLELVNETRLPQTTVPDAATFSQTINQMYRNLSLGGLEVQNGEATIAWEASPGSLAGLSLLNLASNVLVNRVLGARATPRIVSYFQNLPGTRIIDMAPALKWEGFFGASMGLWPAFFALYVSAERRSAVQAMQLSNGMTPAGLWLGHLLFDLPWVVFIATAVVIVLAAATNQFYALGALWVVLVLYGIAGALFTYVVSTFLPSPLASFAVAGGYNGMMSMLYGSAYILTLAYTPSSESKQALEVVHYIASLLSPVVSVVRAVFVSINVFSLLCDGFGNRDHNPPSSMKKFGSPIVYLIGWICFLFSLLIFIEYGKPMPKWLRARGDDFWPEKDAENIAAQSGVFAPEVRAEAERVRGSQDNLRLLGVGKTFSGFTAVENVSFGVDNGVFAMLGPNGAGKTTMFNIIRGNIRPTRGDVLVGGKSIVDVPAAARLSLGVTPQFSAVDSQLTVKEHMMIYGSFKGLKGEELIRNVDLLMEATALTQYEGRLASKLSGGNARNPRVLLIDEYSTGVDPATKRAMWKTLQRVSHGKPVVITTHSMEEASALASRVGILSRRMLAIGTPDSLVSRFSTYEVHFSARTPIEMSRVNALMSRLPGARRVEDVATRFEVPIGQTSLAELFKILSAKDETQSEVSLDYTVERLGLESVFLKVVQEHVGAVEVLVV